MENKSFVLLRIIDTIEYTPLKRSVKFAKIISELPEKQQKYLLEGFAKYISNEIVRQVKTAIETQNFKVFFKPLSPQYLDYKKRNKLELGFWRSTDFLLNHITVWKYKKEYRIGFQKNVSYENDQGKKTIPVYKVAQYLEFGTRLKDGRQNIPARPIFRPITAQVSKNVTFYLDRYLSTVDFAKLPK